MIKNKKKKKINYKAYVENVVITLIIVTIISVISIFLPTRDSVSKTENLEQYESELVQVFIDKYENEKLLNPNNYISNIKLAELYEFIEDYKSAEQEYLDALQKPDSKKFNTLFKLAYLYLKMDEPKKALTAINMINDYRRPSLLAKKGLFFEEYANYFVERKNPQKALPYFEEAEKLQKKGNIFDLSSLLRKKQKAYILFAEQKIRERNIKEAIELLNIADKIEKTPIIMYNLAILNIEENPELAVKYFEKVEKLAPKIINFNLYKKLLSALNLNFLEKNNELKSKYYQSKFNRLESSLKINLINPDEIQFLEYKFKTKEHKIRNQYDLIFNFTLQNRATYDINNLVVMIDFFDENNQKIFSYDKKIFDGFYPLESFHEPFKVKLNVKTKKSIIKNYNKIYYKLYFTKNPKYGKSLYVNNSFDVKK